MPERSGVSTRPSLKSFPAVVAVVEHAGCAESVAGQCCVCGRVGPEAHAPAIRASFSKAAGRLRGKQPKLSTASQARLNTLRDGIVTPGDLTLQVVVVRLWNGHSNTVP